MKSNSTSLIADLYQFDEIIDVRTPAEFELDHVPGAVNFAVLSNEERVIVGTKHKQESPFEAKKLGATLIARNIATHLEKEFANRPKNWKPLIYCWRGGKRSGAMGHILRQIGWDAHVLQGGYKSYRAWVLEQLKDLPHQFTYQVITGRTGSAKSIILEALQDLGCQVLDLEKYANHKGSVLGGHPETAQPSQKSFESQIVKQLQTFKTDRPVFIEAESRKVGVLQVPDDLLEKIRSSSCIRISASMSARVEFLKRDYVYMMKSPELLTNKLSHLKSLLGQEQLDEWQKNILEQQWDALVQSLLELHYDRLYERSQERNFAAYQNAPEITTDDLSEARIKAIVQDMKAKYDSSSN
jgi:tRNA 2-selenouridine synthase